MGMGTVSHRGTTRQVISQVGGAHDNRPAIAPVCGIEVRRVEEQKSRRAEQ